VGHSDRSVGSNGQPAFELLLPNVAKWRSGPVAVRRHRAASGRCAGESGFGKWRKAALDVRWHRRWVGCSCRSYPAIRPCRWSHSSRLLRAPSRPGSVLVHASPLSERQSRAGWHCVDQRAGRPDDRGRRDRRGDRPPQPESRERRAAAQSGGLNPATWATGVRETRHSSVFPKPDNGTLTTMRAKSDAIWQSHSDPARHHV